MPLNLHTFGGTEHEQIDNDDSDAERQAPVNGSPAQRDSDDSGEPHSPLQPALAPRTSEEPIILDLDDSDSGAENGNQQDAQSSTRHAHPTHEQRSQSHSRRRRSKRSSAKISYADCFDSGDELVLETPHEKKRRLVLEPKEVDSLDLFAEELETNPRKAKTHRNLIIRDYEINLVHYINLFKECGIYLNELSIGTSSPTLLKLIGSNCPNLTVLTIRKSDENCKYGYSIMDSRQVHPSEVGLCNLKRLNIGVNQSFNVETELEMIFQESKKVLQEFRFTFRHLHELDQALRILSKCTWLRKFKKLELDLVRENGALKKQQFVQLTELPFNLESIEIVAGIWEDVTSEDLNGFLQRYSPTLKNLAIHGNRQGEDLMDKSLKIEIPKMEALESMTIGSVYEFEETFEDHLVEQPSTSRAAPAARPSNVISLTDKHLMTIVLNFPHIMPELETIIFGHLVEIDQVHPKTFPGLKVFRVGSAWNTSVFIPNNGTEARFPSYPLVSEIQLPDCLKDEFFARKIRQLFPNLLKVWLYLPSVKVLFQFIEAMAGSKLEKLHLKTQFDFEGTLESAILSKPWKNESRSRANKSTEVLEQLTKLKNRPDDDKVYNDFIKYHNIQFPLTREDRPSLSHGLGGLTSLRVLDIEHVARVLRIPTRTDIPFYHKDAQFHPYLFLGFKKYPLSPSVYNDEIRDLQKLEEFNYTKGFSVSLSKWNVKGVGQLTTKDEDVGSFEASSGSGADARRSSTDFKRLKVKLKPSMLQSDLVKIKPEKEDEGASQLQPGPTSSTAVVKTEVKADPS